MRTVGFLTLGLMIVPTLAAQEFTVNAPNVAGLPGNPVAVAMTISSTEPARGFSFGLVYDPNVATLVSIDQGSDLQALNGGAGADFFFSDVNPVNGPGGITGCVVSLEEPIEDIPAGSNEVAIYNFNVAPGAVPGAVTPLDFSSSLGTPPVAVVISVAGVSHVLSDTAGSVQVQTPSVTDLTCSVTDPCTCQVLLSWTNAATYQGIEIFEQGSLVATLNGLDTSFSLNLAQTGMSDLGVIAVGLNDVRSTLESCGVDCPPLSAPSSPEDLACPVNTSRCEANLSWNNPDEYAFIDIVVNDVVDQTLPGDATAATVSLIRAEITEICLQGATACDLAFAEVCCVVSCTPSPNFVRGDATGDGFFNGLLDALFVLNFAFIPGAPAPFCLESCDADNDQAVNGILDALYMLNFAFIPGSPVIPAPHPDCGPDPEPETTLGCDPNGCP